MEQLKKRKLTTSRSLQYTYYVSSPSIPSLPTVLLLHGWPDDAHMWSDLISNHLLPAGYGVLAPDCLGYSGTSKPTTTSSYNSESMSADLCEILDAEHISKVISLGHDWSVIQAAVLITNLSVYKAYRYAGAASSPNASGYGIPSAL
jgi:soluble epoxide hydrolase / lipid-phosphate phosphatase